MDRSPVVHDTGVLMFLEDPNRIVVTGMGVVSPLGVGVEQAWERLASHRSGIRRLPDDAVPDVASKIAAIVPDVAEDPFGFDIEGVVPFKDRRKMDRFIHFALEAARQAIVQADWTPNEAGKDRTATIVASGIGGFHSMLDAVNTVQTRGAKRLSPFTVSSFLVNLAAGQISIQHGFRGPLGAPVTACAASVQAIGDGANAAVRDYYLLPWIDLGPQDRVRLAETNGVSLDAYRFEDLERFFELTGRATLRSAA